MRCSALLRRSRWLLPATALPPPRSQRASLLALGALAIANPPPAGLRRAVSGR